MTTLKHIKAFTLSELLVVLIITTIVISLAFTVLQLVQNQLYAIKTNYTNSITLTTLETSLWLDFNRYNDIQFNIEIQELQFKNALDSVSYHFLEQQIIKAQDTFNIPLQNKILYFDGKVTKGKKVDAIKLITNQNFQNQQLFIFKKNDAFVHIK